VILTDRPLFGPDIHFSDTRFGGDILGVFAGVSHPRLVEKALIPRRLCFACQFVDTIPLTVLNQTVMEVVARLYLGS
jgi:hypothetical protein